METTMSKMRRTSVKSAMHSWRSLNAVLATMDEADVMSAIEMESASMSPRITVLARLRKRLAAIKTVQARDAASEHVLNQTREH